MRSAYSERVRVTTDIKGPSKTVQYFKDECSIDNILKKHATTGMLWTTRSRPRYGDFTGIEDYRSMLDRVQKANDAFLELPADIRQKFNNDAAAFVEFCSNQDNLEEMRRMGLAPEAQEIPSEIVQNEAAQPAD